MNQNDQQLITQLAGRLQKAQPVTKDPQAAELIIKEIAAQPDAVYLLTQSVLLQEAAIRQLQQAQKKKGFFSSWFGGGRQTASQNQAPYARTSSFGQGSFLGSALSTAAGVAGGMFLFQGLSHLFSGGSSVGADMADTLQGDPLQGQTQMLDDGFGTGDSFMGDAGMGADSSDFGGGFDDGFGGGGDW